MGFQLNWSFIRKRNFIYAKWLFPLKLMTIPQCSIAIQYFQTSL
jgi:hypothetical protein